MVVDALGYVSSFEPSRRGTRIFPVNVRSRTTRDWSPSALVELLDVGPPGSTTIWLREIEDVHGAG